MPSVHSDQLRLDLYLMETKAQIVSTKPRMELQEEESFETDFLGASVEECGDFLRINRHSYKWWTSGLLFVVDERSAQDHTVVLAKYAHSDTAIDGGCYGQLPPEENRWYTWRLRVPHLQSAIEVLGFGNLHTAWSVYFGNRDYLTDQDGIFDGAEAEHAIAQPEVTQGLRPYRRASYSL